LTRAKLLKEKVAESECERFHERAPVHVTGEEVKFHRAQNSPQTRHAPGGEEIGASAGTKPSIRSAM
jgi:hypothetical protein